MYVLVGFLLLTGIAIAYKHFNGPTNIDASGKFVPGTPIPPPKTP